MHGSVGGCNGAWYEQQSLRTPTRSATKTFSTEEPTHTAASVCCPSLFTCSALHLLRQACASSRSASTWELNA